MPINVFTTIDDPSAVNLIVAVGINGIGQIVGQFEDGSSGFHGFLLSGDAFTTIDKPLAKAKTTDAEGINDLGEIVGTYRDATGTHGFFRVSSGDFKSFDVPSAADTMASGINDQKEVVGSYLGITAPSVNRRTRSLAPLPAWLVDRSVAVSASTYRRRGVGLQSDGARC